MCSQSTFVFIPKKVLLVDLALVITFSNWWQAHFIILITECFGGSPEILSYCNRWSYAPLPIQTYGFKNDKVFSD